MSWVQFFIVSVTISVISNVFKEEQGLNINTKRVEGER